MKTPEKFLDATTLGNCPVRKTVPAKADANLKRVVNNELFYFC